MEQLFENNIFLIFLGITLYYAIRWSGARNKKSNARNARLAICEGKAERAMVYADEKYTFNSKEWRNDNKDELVVAIIVSFLMIGFDQLFAEMINRRFFANNPIEFGKAIYLLGGVCGDLLSRLYGKITGS